MFTRYWYYIIFINGTVLWAMMASFFVGVGMGLTTTSFIVSIQSAVPWNQRGAATAANSFMRNLGRILNARLRQHFEQSDHQANVLESFNKR